MILCLHDFGDFWYGWRNQLRNLSQSNWVVALDMKGFGDSEKPFLASKYKDEVIIEELKQLIDVLQENDKKIVLIGHGLGGHIAWKFVEKYPWMVRKFISVSTPHPRIWLKHILRSWRSVIENRWLYVCRLPFLPEMEMVQNDLEVFDNKFRKSSSVTDLSNFSNFDKVHHMLNKQDLVYPIFRKHTSTHFPAQLTGKDLSTTSDIFPWQTPVFLMKR